MTVDDIIDLFGRLGIVEPVEPAFRRKGGMGCLNKDLL